MKILKKVALALVVLSYVGGTAYAEEARESRNEVRDAMKQAKAKSRQATRGGLVYKTYCVLCHGAHGDGAARIAKLHGGLNLVIGKQTDEYYEKIIRDGGGGVARSDFMPTWDDELSDEQISDVVAYLSLVTDPVHRGEVVFKTNCILCHGVNGDGKGRASELYDPPPANLTISDKNDDYKRSIITMGGAAMGRSPVMPIWGEQLGPDEINDVVAYLRTILVVPPTE
ncbi:MAG: c-type cytochrome [Pseudomonadota bacterium]|nr:c-type cytochrome [Pseudomonadota bacterium]